MTTQKLKRYTYSIIAGSGSDQGTLRDSGEVIATGDAEAWSQTHTRAGANAFAQDGDYLQLTESGRGVKGTPLRKLG